VENYENYNYQLKLANPEHQLPTGNWQLASHPVSSERQPPDIIAKASSCLFSEHFNTVAAVWSVSAASRLCFLWLVVANTNQLDNVAVSLASAAFAITVPDIPCIFITVAECIKIKAKTNDRGLAIGLGRGIRLHI